MAPAGLLQSGASFFAAHPLFLEAVLTSYLPELRP